MLSSVKKSCLIAILVVLSTGNVYADDSLEAGVRAFDVADYKTAAKRWLPLAEQGNVEAQLFMGVLHAHGLGVARSPQQSAYWYERAAENGDVDAQNEIGFYYELGLGVKQDDRLADSWYRQVEAQGYCLKDTLPTGRLVLPE